MTLIDIKHEIDYTLNDLKQAITSSHKDYCMRKLEALYTLENLIEEDLK